MPDRLDAGSVVAGYRLLQAIGDGSNSRVFVAQPAAGGAMVALKLVALAGGDAAAADRAAFVAAAAVARRLQHPGIVAVHDAGVDGDIGWLAMERVTGGDLAAHSRPGRLLPLPQLLRVGERIGEALAYAHRSGVVHRDLKPANVLVDASAGQVKIADFGLARAADGVRTATGLVPGSPAYMAPEQLAGALPSAQGDCYAFGVLLFELLCARLPHEAASMGELLRRVACEPAPDVQRLRPGLPPALAALVARLLDKRADRRPADGELIAAELRSIRHALAGRD